MDYESSLQALARFTPKRDQNMQQHAKHMQLSLGFLMCQMFGVDFETVSKVAY